MSKKTYVLYSDGACKFNNSKIKEDRRMFVCVVDDRIVDHFHVRGSLRKGGSNNIAELLAVSTAMGYAFKKRYKNVLLRIDSQVVYWWFKNGHCSSQHINDYKKTSELLEKVLKLKNWFTSFEIEVVPRSDNKAGVILDKKIKGQIFV